MKSERWGIKLKLFEFEPGTEITICSRKKHSYHEFSTNIIRSIDEGTLAKIVFFDNRMVRFSRTDARHEVTINAGAKAYTFHDVNIREVQLRAKTSQLEDKFALVLETDEDVTPVNRRNFFRVFLGAEGEMRTGEGRKPQEVVIKDISANGLGVICDKKLKFPVGTNAYVNFVDDITGESFKLECVIVRCVENQDNTFLYGCQLPESDDAMERFVALKQRIH